MPIEISPEKWSRFGNVINTSEGVAIYCVELSGFPETHLLTKFKSDNFTTFSKIIENIGWKYEKVESWKKTSGSVSRVETENYIFFLDEQKRTWPLNYIDSAPQKEIKSPTECPIIRSEFSDIY